MVGFRHDSGVECCKLLSKDHRNCRRGAFSASVLAAIATLLLEYSKIWESWS